jgi:predicted porin
MKKSLVALAVMAAAGAVSAQSVTLSGQYSFGYAQNKSTAQVGGAELAKASGFGTDTAAVKFSATEDLGGGLKATAAVSAGNLARGGSVAGEDATLTLAGGFGSVRMGTVESGNGIRVRAEAGAPVLNLETEVFSAASNLDTIAYTSPDLSGFKLGVSYTDRGEGIAAKPAIPAVGTTPAVPAVLAGGNDTGLGFGTAGQTTRQPTIGFSVSYANGPINAAADLTTYTRKDSTKVNSNNDKNRFRISGNYDLGVVKLGAGFSNLKKTTAGGKVVETAFGLSAPLGPVTVGAFFATQKTSTSVGTTGKNTGSTFGLKYDLSKRTNVTSNFATWKRSSFNAATGVLAATSSKNNRFEVLMNHTF